MSKNAQIGGILLFFEILKWIPIGAAKGLWVKAASLTDSGVGIDHSVGKYPGSHPVLRQHGAFFIRSSLTTSEEIGTAQSARRNRASAGWRLWMNASACCQGRSSTPWVGACPGDVALCRA
jgi:hypothetical protein